MPRVCSVPGCRSNYNGEEYITVFKFPSDEKRKELWERKIHRDNFKATKYSGVCVKHFDESFIIRSDTYTDKSGETITVKRDRLALSKDAYPTIMGDVAPHLTEILPKKRKTMDDREEEQLERALTNSIQSYQEEDTAATVNSLEGIVEFVYKLCKENKAEGWGSIQFPAIVILCQLSNEHHSTPKMKSCITIRNDMSFSVCVNDVEISAEQLEKVNIQFNTIVRTYHIEALLSCCEKIFSGLKCISYLELGINLLEKHKETLMEDDNRRVDFLVEQLKLIGIPKQRLRFSNELLYLAFKMFLSSAACYKTLRSTKVLILPHPRTLSNLARQLNVTSEAVSPLNDYMKQRCKNISEQQKIVSLLIDEIYVEPKLSFNSSQIFGASFDSNEIAKTAQVFLISSIFSSYKDVIAIAPISKFDGNKLHQLTRNLLKDLHELELSVLCVITDNNNINRSMFSCFKPHPNFQGAVINPINTDSPLYLMYDPVHLLKSIRNNWINSNNTVYHYPDFEDFSIVREAKFSHLRLLYDIEREKLLKYSHVLTLKSLYPSNIDRQKVSLALKVFNQQNSVALSEYGPKHHFLNGWEGTAGFIRIIHRFWKIVNVKSPNMGHRFRDNDLSQITNADQEQIKFLQKFHSWLQKWECMSRGQAYNGLTSRTFHALMQTCIVLYEMVIYIFNTMRPEYVLLGKLQTDPLEERFSLYRQLSGANYHISIQQLLENEKKIRIKNILRLKSSIQGVIDVTEINVDNCAFDESFSFDPLHHLDLNDVTVEISEMEAPVLLYIAGYAAHKLVRKYSCPDCKKVLCNDTGTTFKFENEDRLISAIDRGGLTKPSFFVVSVTIVVFKIFQKLLSKELEEQFLKCKNPINAIKTLTLRYIHSVMDSEVERFICAHHSIWDAEKSISVVIGKILLNNYVRNRNQAFESKKNDGRKCRKFK